jgi:hypothetical protein
MLSEKVLLSSYCYHSLVVQRHSTPHQDETTQSAKKNRTAENIVVGAVVGLVGVGAITLLLSFYRR